MLESMIIPNGNGVLLAVKIGTLDIEQQKAILGYLVKSEYALLPLSKWTLESNGIFSMCQAGIDEVSVGDFKGYLDFSRPGIVLFHGDFDSPELALRIFTRFIEAFSELEEPKHLFADNVYQALVNAGFYEGETEVPMDEMKHLLSAILRRGIRKADRDMAGNLFVRLTD